MSICINVFDADHSKLQLKVAQNYSEDHKWDTIHTLDNC